MVKDKDKAEVMRLISNSMHITVWAIYPCLKVHFLCNCLIFVVNKMKLYGHVVYTLGSV